MKIMKKVQGTTLIDLKQKTGKLFYNELHPEIFDDVAITDIAIKGSIIRLNETMMGKCSQPYFEKFRRFETNNSDLNGGNDITPLYDKDDAQVIKIQEQNDSINISIKTDIKFRNHEEYGRIHIFSTNRLRCFIKINKKTGIYEIVSDINEEHLFFDEALLLVEYTKNVRVPEVTEDSHNDETHCDHISFDMN